MIKSDFLIRQLSQFIQALLDLLLKRQGTVVETEPAIIDHGISLLGLTREQFFTLSGEELIRIFSDQLFALEKMEAAAYLLLVQQQDNKFCHQEVALELLTYVSENSDTYSIERNRILNQLKDDETKRKS